MGEAPLRPLWFELPQMKLGITSTFLRLQDKMQFLEVLSGRVAPVGLSIADENSMLFVIIPGYYVDVLWPRPRAPFALFW